MTRDWCYWNEWRREKRIKEIPYLSKEAVSHHDGWLWIFQKLLESWDPLKCRPRAVDWDTNVLERIFHNLLQAAFFDSDTIGWEGFDREPPDDSVPWSDFHFMMKVLRDHKTIDSIMSAPGLAYAVNLYRLLMILEKELEEWEKRFHEVFKEMADKDVDTWNGWTEEEFVTLFPDQTAFLGNARISELGKIPKEEAA